MGYITSSSRHHTSRVHLATATWEWNRRSALGGLMAVLRSIGRSMPKSSIRSSSPCRWVHLLHGRVTFCFPSASTSDRNYSQICNLNHTKMVVSSGTTLSIVYSFVRRRKCFFCLFETFPRLQLCIPSRFGWHVAVVARRSQM